MTFISTFDDESVRIDASLLSKQISEKEIESALPDVDKAAQLLHSRKGPGNEFLGWLEPEGMITDDELYRLKKVAANLRGRTDSLVVIGIGGSYLGTRACYETLRKPGAEYVLLYAGTNLSPRYHHDLLATVAELNFGINVVSKSGTTTEPAIAFRMFREALENQAGPENAGKLIVATTDRKKGALRQLADSEGWETFVVPDDIGGRYSVLTPVGLFPLAYAGIDVDALVGGATECALACRDERLARNPAKLYSAVRHLLWKKGLSVEILATFEPRLEMLIEWWKQLFGESQGKEGQGIFPAGVVFTRDLHSLGQWIQDGARIAFETFLDIREDEPSVEVPKITGGGANDGLTYLEGRDLGDINNKAREAVRIAHADGGCPNLAIEIPLMDEYHLGVLVYFFEYTCALTGYMAGINPFDQPGVEVYKKNMFKLLGKPGAGTGG
jgi:glucose-6-phosphate isomerase